GVIADSAGQKGTGRWTVQIALELGVPVNVIAESVFARSVSGHADLRAAGQEHVPGPTHTFDPADRAELVEDVRKALWTAKVVAYAQGMDLIRTASMQYEWQQAEVSFASRGRAG